ncbi:MAG: FMN-binding protein [Kiritimatiellae bacterium]|nr:FMN-binding protein [Kiritimatiellia bacterium]
MRPKAYAVAFTVGLSGFCAVLLTFANVQWQARIAANENFAKICAVVDALGLEAGPSSREETIDLFNRSVTVTNRGVMTVYEGRAGDRLTGFAFEVVGHGKYGPIKGILAVGAETQTILALNIYEQNETPGLGARITAPDWLAQFRGIPLLRDGAPGVVISSRSKGPNVVDGITGASKTTYVIEKIINKAIAQFLSGGMDLEELDLGLTADAVTRATPGYPKHLDKPPHLREEVKRPPFMAPPGAVNLARGKPVTSSMADEPVIGELAQITDGIKRSGEFDYVELDFGLQWVQIDLGREETVYAIAVWHYYKNPVIYNDVIVQVADDAAFTQNVRTLFNNDHDNSAGLGTGTDTAYYARWWAEIVDARGANKQGTPARYVRVYTHGGAGDAETRFVEIAVYGAASAAGPPL